MSGVWVISSRSSTFPRPRETQLQSWKQFVRLILEAGRFTRSFKRPGVLNIRDGTASLLNISENQKTNSSELVSYPNHSMAEYNTYCLNLQTITSSPLRLVSGWYSRNAAPEDAGSVQLYSQASLNAIPIIYPSQIMNQAIAIGFLVPWNKYLVK
jgi:hypothetical protein